MRGRAAGWVLMTLTVACGGDDRPAVDGGPAADVGPRIDTGMLDPDGGAPGACVPAPGWTVEMSPLRGRQGIAADDTGTLHVVGPGASGLEVHRRASDGAWSGPEESGLMVSWTTIGAVVGVAVGPGGELVVESETASEVAFRDAAGTWSLDTLGAPVGVTSDGIFDADGTVHLVRREGMLQHYQRAPGGAWEAEVLAGFPDVVFASVGELDGAVSVCAVSFPDLLCASRDGAGSWSPAATAPVGLEVRGVVAAGARWVIGNLERPDMEFVSTRTVVEPAAPEWRTVAMDVSPTPDASAISYFVAEGPGGDIHLVHQVIDVEDPDAAYLRYLRIAADGSTSAENVACEAYRPDITVLPDGRPVILFDAVDEAAGTLASFLSFGPAR